MTENLYLFLLISQPLPSSRRLEDTSNDSDRITQLETRIAQLEMDKAEMKEQLKVLTTELKMLKEERKTP